MRRGCVGLFLILATMCQAATTSWAAPAAPDAAQPRTPPAASTPETREQTCLKTVEALLDTGHRAGAIDAIERLLAVEEDRLVRLRMIMRADAIRLVGKAAPDFEARTPEGQSLSLQDYRGRFVVLHFWATWSLPSSAEIAYWRAIAARHAGPRLAMLGVSFDFRNDASHVLRYMKRREMTWPTAFYGSDFDNPAALLYKVKVIPYSVLIGPDGTVLETDLLGERLVKAVARHLEGGAVPELTR